MPIKNLDSLTRKLEKLSSPAAIEKALTKSALVVQRDAIKNAPVDTSMLRQSISFNVDAASQKATVGTNLEYAPYVEFGTGIFAAEGNGRQTPWSYQDAKGIWHHTIGQKPQPFLYPALVSNRERISQIFKDELTKEVK